MRVLGITLARGGSKTIPKKNIKLLFGEPLLAYTIRAAQASRLTRYVVSTDDDEIATVARYYGAEVVLRPPELATDSASTHSGLLHALEYCEETDEPYVAVADLRATNPFKTELDINYCVSMLLLGTADTVCGVSRCEHPTRIKKIEGERLLDFGGKETSTNRQELRPEAYVRNGSIYATWTNALRNGLHFLPPANVAPYVMPKERGINIDDWIDWELAEALMRKKAQ